jgi:HAD superfamily hydrolase (TIGR01509 family)
MKISDLENIDPYSITNIVFHRLGHTWFHEYFNDRTQNDLFRRFEIGLASADDICDKICVDIGKPLAVSEIEEAWNTMIGETPGMRIHLLEALRKKYNIYLLSNTNSIHASYYIRYLDETYAINFRDLFQEVYFSHEVGMRKPDRKIFEFVLSDSRLIPGETLFIDDTALNVDVASELGIVALHLENNTIENLFTKWLD